MLESVWANNETKDLAEVFIIDVRDEEELQRNWKPFFVRNHFGIAPTIERSWNFLHARRSCDAFAMATLMLRPCADNPMPRFRTLEHLQRWVGPLVEQERRLGEGQPFKC